MRRRVCVLILVVAVLVTGAAGARAQQILVPMDLSQSNHLKAYGLAFFALTKGHSVDWLLNYKGGSFLIPAAEDVVLEARLRDVSFQPVTGSDASRRSQGLVPGRALSSSAPPSATTCITALWTGSYG